MVVSTIELNVSAVEQVKVTRDVLTVDLCDGRSLSPACMVSTTFECNRIRASELAVDWQRIWYSLGRA